jgi:hypothetical protein
MDDFEMIDHLFSRITIPRGGIRWPVSAHQLNEPSGKETKNVDYALEMLKEQRDSASKDRAAEIVQRVKNLHVDEISPGTKVSFVKRFSGTKSYTYLALKVQQENGEQFWYVTGDDDVRTNERFEELLASRLGFEDFQRLVTVPMDSIAGTPIYGWKGAPASLKYDTEGWGADVAPTGRSSSHLVGPSEPGEENPE